jgi:hypothetical protein
MQRNPERNARRRWLVVAVAHAALLAACDESDSRSAAAQEQCSLDDLETFASSIPAGWTVVGGGTGTAGWTWHEGPLPWEGSPLVASGALVDANLVGAYVDADLETPLYELDDCDEASFSFMYSYRDAPEGDDDFGEVYLIPGGVDPPLLVRTFDESSPEGALAAYSFPVNAALLNDRGSFSVLFHYEGGNGPGWYLETVSVRGAR